MLARPPSYMAEHAELRARVERTLVNRRNAEQGDEKWTV